MFYIPDNSYYLTILLLQLQSRKEQDITCSLLQIINTKTEQKPNCQFLFLELIAELTKDLQVLGCKPERVCILRNPKMTECSADKLWLEIESWFRYRKIRKIT